MKKILIIVICFFAISLLSIGVLWVMKQGMISPENPEPNPGGVGGITSGSIGSGVGSGVGTTTPPIPPGKMRIGGVSGSVIVNDVTMGRERLDTGLGTTYFNLDDGATTTPYRILLYQGQDTTLVISIIDTPLGVARTQAETYLLELFGINTETACTLKYSVGVPGWLSEQYSGKNLKFSFCSGAVALPEI